MVLHDRILQIYFFCVKQQAKTTFLKLLKAQNADI